MLQEAVRSFGLKLDNLLHRGITDPKTFHIMAFTAFLDASLSLKGRRRLYEGVLEKVKDLTGHTGARIAATRLVPYASAVIEEVKREVKGASIAEEGSTAWVIRDVASSIKREVDGVFVIDAFSVIEFATLLATCRRNGFMCELRRQVFVNPPGKTDFVKRQVGKGQVRGWLRDYASKLAEEVECGRNYEVYPLFDEALHWTVGDVVCFLEGEGGRNPFELVWEGADIKFLPQA